MLLNIMTADGKQVLNKDLEPIIRFLGVGRVELIVDLLGDELAEGRLAIEESAVLDVEVKVAERDCYQCC